jgi:hypothetical protein
MSDYGPFSDGEILDRIGFLSVEIKKLETHKKELANELIDRGFERGNGTQFHGVYVEAYTSSRLDRERLERDHGEAFLNKYLKYSTVSAQIKVSARTDIAASRIAAE